MTSGKRHFYHRRCELAMFTRIAERPAAYHLRVRHVEAEAN